MGGKKDAWPSQRCVHVRQGITQETKSNEKNCENASFVPEKGLEMAKRKARRRFPNTRSLLVCAAPHHCPLLLPIHNWSSIIMPVQSLLCCGNATMLAFSSLSKSSPKEGIPRSPLFLCVQLQADRAKSRRRATKQPRTTPACPYPGYPLAETHYTPCSHVHRRERGRWARRLLGTEKRGGG